MNVNMNVNATVQLVRHYFLSLQTSICDTLAAIDGKAQFSSEKIAADNGGFSQPRVLAEGKYIEKAAVQFTHSIGAALPPAATARNPHLAGNKFQATAISLIVHPLNPHAPTTHMNLRFFLVESEQPVWYFGGGYDLTPFYAYAEDIQHWHQTARRATGVHYDLLKKNCDEYFYLPHRQECRGVGGLFFDDWTESGFDNCFAFVQAIGDSFIPAYQPLLEKRKAQPYTDAQRNFQLYRRGRYAEFNLAIDRGTQYGMQSGRRIESVLASLPPLVRWDYNYQAAPGSAEYQLTDYFLQPQNWLATQ